MKKIKRIINPLCSILRTSDSNSQLTSEGLYGEDVNCLEKDKNKIFIRLLTDNYTGWISQNYIGELPSPTHITLSPRTFLFSKPNIKSNIVNYLSIGSRVTANEYSKDWSKVIFFHKNQLINTFVLKKNIILLNNKVNDWVSTAESLVNVPYKWGGRSSIGMDCSALIQLSLQTQRFNAPRDSILQKELCNSDNNSLENLKRGSIIFWKGHVGVMVDKKNFLHANTFHMKTTIEPLIDVIKRAKTNNSDIQKIINITLK